MIKNIKLILFALILLLSNACSDDFLQITDPNKPTATTIYTSISNAQSAMNGVYAGFFAGDFLFRGEFFYILMYSTGEAEYVHPESRYTDFNNYNYTSTNTLITGYYQELYDIVVRANSVIQGVRKMENSGNYKGADLTQLKYMVGQCYFLRGLAYSYLIRSFGEKMPTHPDYTPNLPGVILSDTIITKREQMNKERNSCSEVYNYVLNDFKRAENLLPETWPATEAGKATKASAQAFLGETYVYLQKWDSAKIAFDKIVTNSQYNLVSNFKHNFDYKYINNSESLFEVGANNMTIGFGATYIYRLLALQSWGTSVVRSSAIDKFNLPIIVINAQTLADAFAAKNTVLSVQKAYIDSLIKICTPLIGQFFNSQQEFINYLKPIAKFSLYKPDGVTLQLGVKAFMNAVNPKDPRFRTTVFIPKVDSLVVFNPTSNRWEKKLFDYSSYGIRKYISDSVSVENAQDAGMGNNGFTSQNFRIMRLDDVYLYYAEVMHHLGDDSAAKEYLNKLVRRANGLPVNTPSAIDLSSSNIMDEIMHQTYLETCLEGKIWFHYRRWNIANQEWAQFGYKTNKNECLPIPQSEFDSNSGIKTQNPGY